MTQHYMNYRQRFKQTVNTINIEQAAAEARKHPQVHTHADIAAYLIDNSSYFRSEGFKYIMDALAVLEPSEAPNYMREQKT